MASGEGGRGTARAARLSGTSDAATPSTGATGTSTVTGIGSPARSADAAGRRATFDDRVSARARHGKGEPLPVIGRGWKDSPPTTLSPEAGRAAACASMRQRRCLSPADGALADRDVVLTHPVPWRRAGGALLSSSRRGCGSWRPARSLAREGGRRVMSRLSPCLIGPTRIRVGSWKGVPVGAGSPASRVSM
jgi:hypothetical protein